MHSLTAVQSALDWRRAQRTLWGLDDDPQQYATIESYAQPQRQDWPVYDAARGVYVEWTPATSHLESMLELTVDECEQLRCLSIFAKFDRERGKSKKAPTWNYKKLSIVMARWEDTLSEKRCLTRRSMAARRWLYDNNMTYRHFSGIHRVVLVEHASGARKSLYVSTYDLLMKYSGIEVAAFPILYPWSRYGDSDVRDRLCDGGSGTLVQH